MKRFVNWLTKSGVTAAVLLLGMGTGNAANTSPVKTSFGEADGQPVALYTLRNSKGTVAKITNYGGIVQSLNVADRNGKFDDIVLGYDNLQSYIKATPYFGALVGRYGNRIGGAKFT